MSSREHWDAVYDSKAPDAVSWYRPRLDRSLAFVDACRLGADAHIVDIGGGASTLVDDLLAKGFTQISVADISRHALEHSQVRLGQAGETVRWVVGDATTQLFAPDSVDLWHDRAVFHFLTDAQDREAYLQALRASVRAGGFVILATFGPNGPERCSGLPVVRYASEQLAAALGSDFELIVAADEDHATPWGAPQAFSYALCRRADR